MIIGYLVRVRGRRQGRKEGDRGGEHPPGQRAVDGGFLRLGHNTSGTQLLSDQNERPVNVGLRRAIETEEGKFMEKN